MKCERPSVPIPARLALVAFIAVCQPCRCINPQQKPVNVLPGIICGWAAAIAKVRVYDAGPILRAKRSIDDFRRKLGRGWGYVVLCQGCSVMPCAYSCLHCQPPHWPEPLLRRERAGPAPRCRPAGSASGRGHLRYAREGRP